MKVYLGKKSHLPAYKYAKGGEKGMTNAGIAGKECRDKERLFQVAQATFVTTLKLSARNDKIK